MFASIGKKLWSKTQSHSITDYETQFIPCYTKSENYRVAIRSYKCDGVEYYLAVDPQTLATETLAVKDCSSRAPRGADGKPTYLTKNTLDSTPYVMALNTYNRSEIDCDNFSPDSEIQNQGLKHSAYKIQGAFLTIDMCPSSKPFEKKFFEELVAKSSNPTPIAICISGLWLIRHAEEFKWLTKQQQNHKLQITWVNHSLNHIYYADLVSKEDLKKNFLLAERTNLPLEITKVEKLLLEKGEVPSVFFRAPGLVTNRDLLDKLNDYGLIPVGSDAWLNKDEKPDNGSIILVHGNSNEPGGIEKAMPLLDQQRFKFFPLAKAVVESPCAGPNPQSKPH